MISNRGATPVVPPKFTVNSVVKSLNIASARRVYDIIEIFRAVGLVSYCKDREERGADRNPLKWNGYKEIEIYMRCIQSESCKKYKRIAQMHDMGNKIFLIILSFKYIRLTCYFILNICRNLTYISDLRASAWFNGRSNL